MAVWVGLFLMVFGLYNMVTTDGIHAPGLWFTWFVITCIGGGLLGAA